MYNYRRSRTQDKYQQQVVKNLGILLVVIILLSTLGINLLIKSTTLITRLFDRNDNESQVESDLILPPELFEIPDATNSAQLKVIGRGQLMTKVTVYVNDDPQAEISLEKEEFELEVNLETGENQIYAIAEETKRRITAKSTTYSVIFIDVKPNLEVTVPQQNQTFYKREINILGKTDPGNTVLINSRPTTVDSLGGFGDNFRLNEGTNEIVIEAKNSAGTITLQEITAFYEKE